MTKRILILTSLLILYNSCIYAQNEKEMIARLVEEDRETVEALVMYPEETRMAIFEAALYPELLIRAESLQKSASDEFRAMLEGQSREVQEMVYELSRYPGLIEQIVSDGPLSRAQLQRIASEYPERIRSAVVEAGSGHYRLLRQADQLLRGTESAFESMITGYPEETQAAYRHLMELPEVLSILLEDIRLTILTGDLYRKDPQWIMRKADSLHLVVARQNAEELRAWKEELSSDPEVREDLAAVSEDFEEAYSFDDEYYDEGYDDLYYDEEPDRVIVEHHYYHYPFWVGYPYWYEIPRWRPYPSWWDCGYYFSSGTIVVIRLPSYFFTRWYLYHPHHHYYHPHLTSHFIDHYYGYRYTSSTLIAGVENWRRDNPVLVDDFIEPEEERVGRIKQFAEMEMAREKLNARRPEEPLTQLEYVERYSNKYSDMERSLDKARISTGDKEPQRVTVRPTEKEENLIKKAPVEIRPEKKIEKVPYKQPEKKEPDKPQQLDKARELHKSKWDLNRRKEPAPPQTVPKKPVQKQPPPVKKEPVKKEPVKKPSKRGG